MHEFVNFIDINDEGETLPGASSEQLVNLYDYWSATKGRYRPARSEYQAKRIELIESTTESGMRQIEYTMYAFELSGKVRGRRQLENDVIENSGQGDEADTEKLLAEERLAQLVQAKVESVYQELVSAYGYSELSQLRKLTMLHTSKNTAALLALERLYNKNLIGPVALRTSEAIIRVMIAEEEGLTEKLPSPNHPSKLYNRI